MPKELIGNFKHGQDIEDQDYTDNMPDALNITDAD
jgi:hypothetical protein